MGGMGQINIMNKIIHQIWIGPLDSPDYMHTWKDFNPEYEYILWDNEKVKELFPLINQRLYDLYDNEEINVWNGRANLLRLEILNRFGGIYIDADCECLRKLEGDFLDLDFFGVYANDRVRGDLVNNCVIGSIANHPILDECIAKLNKSDKIQQPSSTWSGPGLITEVLKNYDVRILPSYYFSPVFYHDGAQYEGNFKPFGDHKWFTTMIQKYSNLGHWSIDKECLDKIRELLPEGSAILELGSGAGTGALSEYYTMYSIEHDSVFIGKYKSTYIYAPAKRVNEDVIWYDPDCLKVLPNYDMILVDGPPGNLSKNPRSGFRLFSHLFNMDVLIICDDVNRENELNEMKLIAKELNREYEIFESGFNAVRKAFGVIYKK